MLALLSVPQNLWAWGGQGTSGAPYTISTANDLVKFADIVNGTNGATRNVAAWGKLTADINLNNAAWTAMGSSANPYTGTFDGQGHKITGLNLTATAANAGQQCYDPEFHPCRKRRVQWRQCRFGGGYG